MRSNLSALAALFVGAALLLLGNGLLNTLIPLSGELRGFSTQMLGLLSSAYFIGFFLGIWLVIPMIKRVGHIRTFTLCAAIAASATLLHVLLPHLWVWLLLRVLYGIALVSIYAVIESWLNAVVPTDSRSGIFSVYMVISLGAVAAAQPLLILDSPLAFTLFALAALLLCLALVPISLTRLAQPNSLETPSFDVALLWRKAPLAMAACFGSGMLLGAFYGLTPVFGSAIGLQASGIALLMSSAIVGGILGQFPLGYYSDRHDRRRVMLVICMAIVPLGVLMLLLSASSWLYLLLALWGSLSFVLYPIAIAHMVDLVENDEIVPASTGLLMIYGAGAALGPILAGYFMALLGSAWLPVFFSLVVGSLAFVLWRGVQSKPKELASTGQFAPMMRTTPQSLEMMPNVSDEDYEALQEDEVPIDPVTGQPETLVS